MDSIDSVVEEYKMMNECEKCTTKFCRRHVRLIRQYVQGAGQFRFGTRSDSATFAQITNVGFNIKIEREDKNERRTY